MKLLLALLLSLTLIGCTTTTIIREVPTEFHLSQNLTKPCVKKKSNITKKSMQSDVGVMLLNFDQSIDMCNLQLQGIREAVDSHNESIKIRRAKIEK